MKSEIQNKIQQDYFVAMEAAVKAGVEIMKVYGKKDFQIELKEDDSPVTLADKSANNIIIDLLRATGIPIISEENEEIPFSEREKWNKCWIVDPLDGTKEFIKKSGEFTVNIALIENNKPVFGVIYIPVSKELYYGDVIAGRSYKILINEKSQLEDVIANAEEIFPGRIEATIKVAGSRSHINKETLGFIDALKEKYDQDVAVIPKGSSLKFCLMAEGRMDVYPRLGPTMEWDTAAGHAICKAVGLLVMDKGTGQEMVYNRRNLLNNSFVVSNLG